MVPVSWASKIPSAAYMIQDIREVPFMSVACGRSFRRKVIFLGAMSRYSPYHDRAKEAQRDNKTKED